MKTEKVLLSFVAVVVGLIVAGIGFYIYQSTKAIPNTKLGTVKLASPTRTPPSVFLTVDTPQNESTTDSKTVIVSGKTVPDATILISTATGDQILKPSTQGNYSTTVTIGNDENQIHVTAIGSAGTQADKIVTITFTTESF